jgi:hypothetical protein
MEHSFQQRVVDYEGSRFDVRPLVPSDLKEYTRIVNTQKEVMKQSRGLDISDFLSEFDYRSTGRNLLVGAFTEEGILRSCVGMFFWADLPGVTDHTMVIDRSYSPLFNPKKSGHLHIIRSMHEYCESKGRYYHYCIKHAKHIDAELKMWDKYTDEFFNRYERYVECIVPAGKRPEWNSFWRMMGRITYPYDVAIHSVRLKQEHRDYTQFVEVPNE